MKDRTSEIWNGKFVVTVGPTVLGAILNNYWALNGSKLSWTSWYLNTPTCLDGSVPISLSLDNIFPSGMGFGMVPMKMAMALWRTVAHGHLVPRPEWGEQVSAKAVQHYYSRVTSLAIDS